jgi:hypothetical protein
MGTITTLRPSSTSSGVGWTPSTGTLHGVTSDNSDATYATWGGSGSALILGTPVDSPPVGERRHQVRLRMRGEDGDSWGAVRLSSGALAAGVAAQFPASPATVTGSWGFGAPADGSTILYTYVTGQTAGVRIEELYIEVDSREAPTFTPQIQDGSGAITTTISDTAQPTIRASAVDLDDLGARQYRYWVTLNGATVWDTGIVSGTATARQTAALDNGSYVAHLQVWSTLGQNTAYPSDEETLAFTVQVGQVAKPENPTVVPVEGSPFYDIQACAPFVEDLDGGVGFVEVQRVDCPVGGYLTLTGSGDSYASAPTPSGTPPVDLELVIQAGRDDGWRPDAEETLASHYLTTGEQRAWRFSLQNDGRVEFAWSEDGTSTLEFATSTDNVPVDPFGNAWVRVRFTADSAGAWLVEFASRDDESSPWAALGEPVIGAVPRPLFNSTADYLVGAYMSGSGPLNRWTGRVYSAQFRSGPDGELMLSPDFSNHLDGTADFEDGQGNPWTVHSPARIYSPTSTVTVAMLGPLESDACASWVDYTLPRTGVGVTCEHNPESCCSYYRARTVGRVDGDLRISDWSDVYDAGIPAGLIVMWPGTNASIPAGWERTTELDGKYPKGVASAATQPGTTGGAATHSHTLPTHTHDTSHGHTVTGASGTATGTVNSSDGAVGTTAGLPTHTHTRSPLNSATVVSGTATPGSGTGSNDPARAEVVFIESDGSPLGVPVGAAALTGDIALSGWADSSLANTGGRYLKGATAGGNGGTTAASGVAAHAHSIADHTHAGTSHTHTSPSTGTFNSNRSLFAGPTSAMWTISHSHPVNVTAATSAALALGGAGSSGAAGQLNPPFRQLRLRENVSAGVSLPVGLICLWRGSLGSIPDNWKLCDGTEGTPDMFGLYPRVTTDAATVGTTGGSLDPHTHTSPSHTHTTGTHNHATAIPSGAAATTLVSSTNTLAVVTGTHTHTSTNSDNATPTVGGSTSGTLASTTTEPPFEEVAFVQLVEEPVPPPDPDVFCLEWDQDQHLIRTTGPNGPMWAPVLGKFEWSVDRPFTAATGLMGSRFVTSAAPGGRDLTMTAAVESEAELARLRAVLARPLVLISPSDASEVWAAPVAESVRIVKVGRIRQVTATFIGTGPEPAPQLADVGV